MEGDILFKRLGIFKSILISYVLITLLPISVFMYITATNFTRSYRSSIIENRMANLDRVQAMLDLRLRECKSLAGQISQNTYISKHNLTSSAYSAYLAIEQLAQMKEANEFLLDIGVYYYGNDMLYSAIGAAQPLLSLQKSYGLSQSEAEHVLELMNHVKRPTMVSLKSNTRVYYIIPLPANYIATYGAAVFMFDDHALHELFYDYEYEFPDQRFWIRGDGELVYTVSGVPFDEQAFSVMPQTGDSIDLSGETYYVLTTQSDVEGEMQVVSLLGERYLTPMLDGYATLLVVTLLLLMSCFGLAVWLALRYWAPIRELSQVLTGEIGRNMRWEPIQAAMRDVIGQNRVLEGQIEDQQHILRENLLLLLIHSQARPMDEIQSDLRELGFDPNCTKGCLMVVRPSNGIPSQEFAGAIFAMLKVRYARYACAVEVDGGRRIAVLLLVDGKKDGEPEELSRQIGDCLNRAGALDWAIGVGRVMPVNRLNGSYLQAAAALGAGSDVQGIHFIDAPAGGANLLPEQREKEMILSMAIREGDGELAQRMIFEMMEYTLNNAPSVFRYTCYSLLNCVMGACAGEAEASLRLPEKDTWHVLAELVDSAMPEEFTHSLSAAVNQICAEFSRLKQAREDQSVRQILDFLEERCLDQDFSLDTLASRFGSSSGYWSRFFKERLGQNFSDYVWRLRLERAKQLLRDTDLAVKDVADRVGYIDTRSFIRKFKNAEGVTPGQYRSGSASPGAGKDESL